MLKKGRGEGKDIRNPHLIFPFNYLYANFLRAICSYDKKITLG